MHSASAARLTASAQHTVSSKLLAVISRSSLTPERRSGREQIPERKRGVLGILFHYSLAIWGKRIAGGIGQDSPRLLAQWCKPLVNSQLPF